MNGSFAPELNLLLNRGAEEANQGNRPRAREYFKQALLLDSYNESALIWLAYLTDDPYQQIDILQTLLKINPRHELAQSYLAEATNKTSELENLVSGSYAYSAWNRMKDGVAVSHPTKRTIPFLGEYLLQEGMITHQQLDMALRRHEELARRGQPKQMGQVMVELGYITQAQLENWLNRQNGEYSYQFRD